MRHLREVIERVCAWRQVDNEEGVAAIEYGLIAALIAIVIVTAASLLGTNLAGVFNVVASKGLPQSDSATPAPVGPIKVKVLPEVLVVD
jgi:pilus assembly protein Flp/PilA